MIVIKNKEAIRKMKHAGQQLAAVFQDVAPRVVAGASTASIDAYIESCLHTRQLKPRCKGYCGYQHVSCISLHDVIVHGVPSHDVIVREGDLVTIDVCASWRGYCADMARTFIVGTAHDAVDRLVSVAQRALDTGIAYAHVQHHVGDIGHHIQNTVEHAGYSVIRDFCGHGIGKRMHEDPDVPNYGSLGSGPALRHGMALAIEPMISAGSSEVRIDDDAWTARTADGSLSAHIEDTVIVTDQGPCVATRLN